MLAASTSASTQELAGFCSSIWRCPRSAWKCPLVVLTDKTRTANDACEWVGSICQIMVILLEHHLLAEDAAHLNCLFQASCNELLNHTRGSRPLRRWNLHSERPYGRLYKERGSRGPVCDSSRS